MQEQQALLQRATARIALPESSGTAFFVTPTSLLTCAHVVKAYEQQPFTIQWEGQSYPARVISLSAMPYPDLALLQLTEAPPDPPCVALDTSIDLHDALFCFGYTRRFPNGEPTSLTYEGMTGKPEQLLKVKAGEILPGFSGSPILNLRTGKVCGIVKSTRGEATLLGGRAIPVSTIFTHFPDLQTAQPSQPTNTIKVYYSYVQQDKRLADRLQTHLKLLQINGYISEWHGGMVTPGQQPEKVNREHFRAAQIILLLVSPEYVAEKSVATAQNFEFQEVMELSKRGTVVVPIYLRQVANWDLLPFQSLLVLPSTDIQNPKPVADAKNKDAVFAKIATEIRGVVEHLRSGR